MPTMAGTGAASVELPVTTSSSPDPIVVTQSPITEELAPICQELPAQRPTAAPNPTRRDAVVQV